MSKLDAQNSFWKPERMIPKKLPTLTVMLIFAGMTVGGFVTHAVAPTTGLVAFYPLDGHANDASGNQLHAVAFNTATTTDRLGNPDGALLFDGATSYVD